MSRDGGCAVRNGVVCQRHLPQRLQHAHERDGAARRPLDVVHLRSSPYALQELRRQRGDAERLLVQERRVPGRLGEGVHRLKLDGIVARLRRRHRSRPRLVRQLLRPLPQQLVAERNGDPSFPQRVHERHNSVRDRHPSSVRVGAIRLQLPTPRAPCSSTAST